MKDRDQELLWEAYVSEKSHDDKKHDDEEHDDKEHGEKKGKYDDGDGKTERCDYVPCEEGNDDVKEEAGTPMATPKFNSNEIARLMGGGKNMQTTGVKPTGQQPAQPAQPKQPLNASVETPSTTPIMDEYGMMDEEGVMRGGEEQHAKVALIDLITMHIDSAPPEDLDPDSRHEYDLGKQLQDSKDFIKSVLDGLSVNDVKRLEELM